MKKLIVLLIFSLFMGNLPAQEAFKVPELTDAAKHNRMVFQANGMLLNSINYAKSLGKSVDEIATFTGEQFKTGWNKERGYAGFVNGMLYNWVCFTPKGQVAILEQNESSIRFKVTNVFPDLKEKGSIFNVTYEEYLNFFGIIQKIIGDYLGAETAMESIEEGVIVTMKKK